ncbi:hypothetical protein ACFPYN_08110 [Paenisporosarcina macmurdoensis]|uniref:Lipoprotein n=1 Tax=Paenisporosarcina macmurdoensis TaxID=212659 RepID=A0ABW1L5Z7_9BACL
MKKFSLWLCVLLVIFCALIGFRYGHILTKDEGTIRLIVSTFILDTTSRDFVKFDETISVTRYVSKNSGESRYDIIKKVLSDLGWSYKTQEGAALFFQKDKDIVVVETKLVTEDYFIWDVPIEARE